MTPTLCFLIYLTGVLSIPADDPVRIDLPVYNQPQTTSNIRLAAPLEPENHPGSGKDSIGNKENSLTNLLSKKITSSQQIESVNYGSGLFSPPVTKRDGALLETEGLGSKTLSVKENVQGLVAGIFQPKPILDTIKEEEKYGNNGDKFYSAGRAIVGGAEGISNFVNAIVEVPGRIFRSITRAASEKLNNFGGKLVGL